MGNTNVPNEPTNGKSVASDEGVQTESAGDRAVASSEEGEAESTGETVASRETARSLNGSTESEPTADDVYEALSNRRRRYALHHLKQLDAEEPIDLAEISTQVAAWETGHDPETLGYDDRKNVHTSLYQFHAPKMDDLGLVNYDRSRGTVELTEHGEDVDIYLETVTGRQIPWATYFLLLSSLMTTVAFGVWFDAPALTAVPDGAWTVFVALIFLVSSSSYAYTNWNVMRVGSEGPPPELDRE
jgi:hypothetical protein